MVRETNTEAQGASCTGDMSLGCDVCLQQINNGNYDLVLARQYDQYAQYMGKYPVSFEFELSNTCNLDCIMCYDEFSTTVAKRHNSQYTQPFSPYDDEFIRQFEEFIPHLKEISFKGGEPFLIKVYMDIWQRIIDLNPAIMVRIITNTTAFNDKIKQMLLKSNFYLNVSIDSLIPERYEKIRRNARFDKTMENITQMLELNRQKGLAHMTIMVCFMTVNWDEMPSFIKFCNENDVAIMFLYITFRHFIFLLKIQDLKLSPIYTGLYRPQMSGINHPTAGITNQYTTSCLPSSVHGCHNQKNLA